MYLKKVFPRSRCLSFHKFHCRNMGPNVDNSRLHELLGRSDDFDELNLMEEGEARYGLVQVIYLDQHGFILWS